MIHYQLTSAHSVSQVSRLSLKRNPILHCHYVSCLLVMVTWDCVHLFCLGETLHACSIGCLCFQIRWHSHHYEKLIIDLKSESAVGVKGQVTFYKKSGFIYNVQGSVLFQR